MAIMTISQVSKSLDVSTRMLRYYEKMGLIESKHREDYAYRIYDEKAIKRLQLIIVLRKLRISLKEIGIILNDSEQMKTLSVIRDNITQLDKELDAINTIKQILQVFVSRLNDSVAQRVHLDLLEDKQLVDIANTLSLSKLNLKEERSMNELNKAQDEIAMKANVRIVKLPPYTVASYHFIGENPEETVGECVNEFVQNSKIYELKPDSRMFGFNHPNPSEKAEHYGYEVWVTIPEDMEVPSHFEKKTFEGGLYAAHTIDFPNFNEWEWLIKWVMNSDKYDLNYSELGFEIMGGCLEEHLNWVYSSHMGWPEDGIDGKIDLLAPIKKKA